MEADSLNKRKWYQLNDDEKAEFLHKRYILKEDVVLSGIKTNTLSRRMRETKSKWIEDGRWDELILHKPTDSPDIENIGANVKTITSRENRIWTVEQLIAACEIDLDVWEITKIAANKWEGYRKNETKDLIWEKGKATGIQKDKGDLFVAPLIQIKVWLVRKEPIAIRPVLRPIEFSISFDKNPIKRRESGIKRALIIPDIQFGFSKNLNSGRLTPFHDRRALDIVLQVSETFGFDMVVWLGDTFDFPNWTDKFIKSPEFHFTIQPALFEGAWWMAKIREATQQAEHYAIEGNHEFRLRSKIMNHFADAYDLRSIDGVVIDDHPAISVPGLINMDKMGITWVGDYPEGQVWINEFLFCEHGNVARTGVGSTARAVLDKNRNSVIFGHIHRIEMTTRNSRLSFSGRPLVACSAGFLGHVDGRIPGHRKTQDWNQGFLLVEYTEDWFNINPFIIDEGNCLFLDGLFEYRKETENEIIELGSEYFRF
jgi:hypothetical protein